MAKKCVFYLTLYRDVFLLTTEDSVYLYDVTAFFPQWRELVKREITDNFSLPAEKCYIITCGRDQYRYKDIVVEGTLREKYSMEEWLHGGESAVQETQPDLIPKVITVKKSPSMLQVELLDDTVSVLLTTADGVSIPGADLCITDADGLFLEECGRLTTNDEGIIVVPVSIFEPGTMYAVGAVEMHTKEYTAPMDQEFIIQINSKTAVIESEEVDEEGNHLDSYMMIWAILILLLSGLTVVVIVQIIKTITNIRRERKE